MKTKLSLLLVLISLMILPATAGVISITNGSPGLFDDDSGTRIVTVTTSEPGYGTGIISDVNIAINFAKASGLGFDLPSQAGTPFYEEIHFVLIGPGGQSVTLIELGSWSSGSDGEFFDGTIYFDDSAPSIVNFGTAPVPGVFRPTGLGRLADFNALSALGTWTLFVEDSIGMDALRFRGYTLDIATTDVAAPEPASMTLIGLGLAGLASLTLRRQARG